MEIFVSSSHAPKHETCKNHAKAVEDEKTKGEDDEEDDEEDMGED